jgi:phage regulator Rha-like protein
MLPILQNQSAPTMTSLEIAELVKSRHDSVKRTIERLYESGAISKPPLVAGDKSANGVIPQFYKIGKRDSYVIVAQLSPEFTAALVDRWQELEQKQAAPQFNIPQTLPEALRLAADLADQLAIAAPKVAVYELLADRKGDVSTTIVAKELGTTAIKLNRFLRDKGVKWLNADLPKAGYESWFNVVADVKNGHEFTQCLVTPDGQLKIAELWSKK